jgi:hypothetical protein
VKSDEEINPMRRELHPQSSMPLKTVEGLHDSQLMNSKDKSKDKKEEENVADDKPKARP